VYFPKHCLHLYIANAISNIEKTFDGNGNVGNGGGSAGNSRMIAAKTRLVRLLCVFLQKLIRNNMWNSTFDEDEEDDLSRVEVRGFLSRNLKQPDAQLLYQQLVG
jgi:CCR4-NOT transcription complex subunit 11